MQPCPYCARSARECWVLPCLELENLLHSGAKAVNRWLRRVGAPFRVEARP